MFLVGRQMKGGCTLRQSIHAVAAVASILLWLSVETVWAADFPFSIQGDRFYRNGKPVFLKIISYSPLEPGQTIADELRSARLQDDLRRAALFRPGDGPYVWRIYPQPTATHPQRVPQAFYDGLRALDHYVTRDIYLPDFRSPDAITSGRAAVDAVMAEIAAANAWDRIFAYEVGNEFVAGTPGEVAQLEALLSDAASYVKSRVGVLAPQSSNWVTWGSWPPSDPLRTDGNPVDLSPFDFASFNAYCYFPFRVREHQGGAPTGRPYAGYLKALRDVLPSTMPLVVSESGLPDSPNTVPDQEKFQPWYPQYRRGGISSEQSAEGLVDLYFDAWMAGAAGFSVFEWCDEWHKTGEPVVQNDHPEEYFGLVRFHTAPTEARFKFQFEAIRRVYSMQPLPDSGLIADITADSAALAPGSSTTLQVHLVPHFAPIFPVYRWETSWGAVVEHSDRATFIAPPRALGPARITAFVITHSESVSSKSIVLDITPTGAPAITIRTLGTSAASGYVENVDMGQYKLAAYIETNQFYVQPFTDMTSVWVEPDGFWRTNISNAFNGTLHLWLVPRAFDPPDTAPPGWSPPGAIAHAERTETNDGDNDLLDDGWEQAHFGSVAAADRFDDRDNDRVDALEEAIRGLNPTVADNDSDGDQLPDSWEFRYFGTLAFGGNDDPDGDGLDDAAELGLGLHPGRSTQDADRDGLPDFWEIRLFGDTAIEPSGPFPGHGGKTALEGYELGLTPISAAKGSGRYR